MRRTAYGVVALGCLAAALGVSATPAVASGPTVTTVAGTGTAGYSGDGGLATAADLSNPAGVALDGVGNVFVADDGANVVRKITPSGLISTVAGTGTAGYSGDGGAATSAQLRGPTDVAIDASGDLFIADFGN